MIQPSASVERDTANYQPEIVIRESPSLSNQIHLEFTVQAGAYSEKPNPIKEFHIKDDSLSIWYGGIESQAYYHHKQSSSTDWNTSAIKPSLKEPAYTITKIKLHKHSTYDVTIEYLLVK